MRVLITGANRGIGLAMAKIYNEQGHEVIAVCRESNDEIEALAAQVISGLDLTDDTAALQMQQVLNVSLGAYYGYRASKAALNAFTKSLAEDLKQHNIYACVLHPGYVQTRMVGFNGDLTPEQAAQGLIQRIEELNAENTGGFWHSNGTPLPW